MDNWEFESRRSAEYFREYGTEWRSLDHVFCLQCGKVSSIQTEIAEGLLQAFGTRVYPNPRVCPKFDSKNEPRYKYGRKNALYKSHRWFWFSEYVPIRTASEWILNH